MTELNLVFAAAVGEEPKIHFEGVVNPQGRTPDKTLSGEDRYRAMSDIEIFRLLEDGDQLAEQELKRRYPSNEEALRKVLGSDYRPPHSATVTQRRKGIPVWRASLESGNMTAAERALGFPRSMLATHTEARGVRMATLQPGDVLAFVGQYDPCGSCQGVMRRAALSSRATIRYWWPGGEEVYTP